MSNRPLLLWPFVKGDPEDGHDRLPALYANLSRHLLQQRLALAVRSRRNAVSNPVPNGSQLLGVGTEDLLLLDRVAEFLTCDTDERKRSVGEQSLS